MDIAEDNKLDEKRLSNLVGVQLYYYGMNLPDDNWLTVAYDTAKKAHSAVSGCGNKCRSEGTRNLFTVQQWQDRNGVACVTITKTPKSNNIRLQQMCLDVAVYAQNKETQKEQIELGAKDFDLATCCGRGPAEKYMLEDAMTACSRCATDEEMLKNGISEEVIKVARSRVAGAMENQKVQRQTNILPGADADDNKTQWTYEEVMADEMLLGSIKHHKEKWSRHFTVVANKLHLSPAVVERVFTKLDEDTKAVVKQKKKEVVPAVIAEVAETQHYDTRILNAVTELRKQEKSQEEIADRLFLSVEDVREIVYQTEN